MSLSWSGKLKSKNCYLLTDFERKHLFYTKSNEAKKAETLFMVK